MPKWRNRQTRSAQNAVRGNSLVGSTLAFGTIRRRDVTAAMPALEAGGRKTVQVQPLSPVPINSRWDSVGAWSNGCWQTVARQMYAGLAKSGRRTRLRAWGPYSIGHEGSTPSARTINTGDRCESLWCSPARSGLLPRSRQIPAGSLRLHARPRSSPRPAAAQDQRPPGGPEGDRSRVARPGRAAQLAAVAQSAERLVGIEEVVGSTPTCGSILAVLA